MRHRLVGADRPAELLAVLGVLDRHLERPLRDADQLGGERRVGTRVGQVERAVAAERCVLGPTFTPSSLTAYCLRVPSIVGVGTIETPSASRSHDEPPPAGRADDQEVRARGVEHEQLLAVQRVAAVRLLGLERDVVGRPARAAVP